MSANFGNSRPALGCFVRSKWHVVMQSLAAGRPTYQTQLAAVVIHIPKGITLNQIPVEMPSAM